MRLNSGTYARVPGRYDRLPVTCEAHAQTKIPVTDRKSSAFFAKVCQGFTPCVS